jgi:hypothetical protein
VAGETAFLRRLEYRRQLKFQLVQIHWLRFAWRSLRFKLRGATMLEHDLSGVSRRIRNREKLLREAPCFATLALLPERWLSGLRRAPFPSPCPGSTSQEG